jgi:hypothetical protein
MEANRLRMRKTAHERPETAKCHRRAILVVEPHCSGDLRVGTPRRQRRSSRKLPLGRDRAPAALEAHTPDEPTLRRSRSRGRTSPGTAAGLPANQDGASRPHAPAGGVSGCDRLACFRAAGAAALSRRQKSASPKLSSTKDDFG